MDKIQKLFRKLSVKDRDNLNAVLDLLHTKEGRKSLDIKKLTASDFYRLRKGRFRIIFHFESSEPVVDSIRLRDSKGLLPNMLLR